MERVPERTYVVGTRKSQLAQWQANHIGRLLEAKFPGFQYRLEHFVTTGDRRLDVPLADIGGKGLFTEELERALQDRTIDLVVHSLKDLPVSDTPGLVLAAMPPRENARDVLIARQLWTLETIPSGGRVGTSSVRRAAQLLNARPDLNLLPLRGNVDTRIRKAMQDDYDAIILAAAGVTRLGLADYIRQELPFEIMLPAPGQGALAVQCRSDDRSIQDLLSGIDHQPTRQAVTAERAFLEALGGGCSAPIAAYAESQDGHLFLTGLVASLDGQVMIRVSGSHMLSTGSGWELGVELAREAKGKGAGRLLAGRVGS